MIRCVFDHLVFVNCYSEVFLDIQEGREKCRSVRTLCQELYLCFLIYFSQLPREEGGLAILDMRKLRLRERVMPPWSYCSSVG